MHLSSRQVGPAGIVDISSRNPGANRLSMQDALARLHSNGQRHIVFNLSECEYMDSAELGELVMANVRAKQMGTPMKIAGLKPKLKDLLRSTRLQAEFEIYETLEAAVASFGEAGETPPSSGESSSS
ncbi:MAG: STAS domain-containing protein [Acidobacteriota bacterium]